MIFTMDRKPAFRLYSPLLMLFVFLTFTLACALPASMSTLVGPSTTPSMTPTSTLTPTPTATPTPEPQVFLEAGRLALRNGDWTGSAEAFRSALTHSGPENYPEAQIGLATSQLRAGQYQEAIETFSIFLRHYPDHELQADAFYLRARAYQYSGLIPEAVADYDRYLELRPGLLEVEVREKVGDLLRANDQPLEAVERYRSAAAFTPAGESLNLQVKIGQALQDAGDLEGARSQFEQVKEQTTSDSRKAAMNLLIGKILEETGDPDGAYALYLESVENYPNSYDTYLGLVALVNANIPVDEFLRGLIDYNAGVYVPAVEAFDRALAENLNGTTLYYRGLTLLRLGDYEGARQDFTSVIEQFPDNPSWVDAYSQKAVIEWAYLNMPGEAVQTYLNFVASVPDHGFSPDMLFAAARTAERAGFLDQAADLWLRVAEEYPSSSMAFQGAFESGVSQFRLGQMELARIAFQISRDRNPEPGKQAKALLWIGKTYQAEGNLEASRTAWEDAARLDPTGYYSERAADLLAGRQPFTTDAVYEFPGNMEAHRLEAESWLRNTFAVTGPDPLNQLDPPMEADSRIQKARELWRLGELNAARDLYDAIRLEYEGNAEATYRLMHELLDQGLFRSAILASRQILKLAGLDDTATMEAPVYFNYIRFGFYFGEVILPEAAAFDLDGLFLLSVARQESLFESFTTSYAAARGLMQVIPSTGAEIAGQLNWPDGYSADDLYRPVVSARFGAYYLSRQRDTFGGDLYTALAAYNAGPGNASVWDVLAPDDPDLFLEVIRLEQPHYYIRAIYEAFTIYRNLYASPAQ